MEGFVELALGATLVIAALVPAVLAFILVTADSKWFGELVFSSVDGGCITIVWATIAAALLTGGIVRRWKTIRLTGLGLLGLSVFQEALVVRQDKLG